MAKARYEGPTESFELFSELIDGVEDLDLKGAKMPYTSLNGHMFSFLDAGGGMALRLAPDAADEFLARYESGVVEQHGRVMKGYVAVPASLLAATDELRPWVLRSRDWVRSLQPKPTKATKKK